LIDDIAPSDKDTTPTSEDYYGDMHTNERPEDDDEEATNCLPTKKARAKIHSPGMLYRLQIRDQKEI